MRGWIVLTDVEHMGNKRPGKPMNIRASAINTLRGYTDGRRVRTVVGVNGTHYHVSETVEEIADMMTRAQE